MAEKATNAEQALRVKAVYKLLIRGRTRSFILQYAAENWQVGERTVDELISRANTEILEMNKTSMQKTLAVVSSNQWELFRRAMKKKDLLVARMVLMDIAKIHGLEKQQITHVIEDNRDLAELSDDALEELLLEEHH